MSDDDYSAMLGRRGRVHTSKDLDHIGDASVLDYLKAIGFKPVWKLDAKGLPARSADKLKVMRPIRAQLMSVDHKPDTYADGIARKQMSGINHSTPVSVRRSYLPRLLKNSV